MIRGFDSLKLAFTKLAYVKKETDGLHYVYSEKGKRLSKGYTSEEEAKKRLAQIEYFKHNKNSSK